jgi:hypothetical protein
MRGLCGGRSECELADWLRVADAAQGIRRGRVTREWTRVDRLMFALCSRGLSAFLATWPRDRRGRDADVCSPALRTLEALALIRAEGQRLASAGRARSSTRWAAPCRQREPAGRPPSHRDSNGSHCRTRFPVDEVGDAFDSHSQPLTRCGSVPGACRAVSGVRVPPLHRQCD